jgi:hypothetical protein
MAVVDSVPGVSLGTPQDAAQPSEEPEESEARECRPQGRKRHESDAGPTRRAFSSENT